MKGIFLLPLSLLWLTACAGPAEPRQYLDGTWLVTASQTGQTYTADFPGRLDFPETGWVSATRTFTLNQEVLGLHSTVLFLGKIDHPAEIYLNGNLVHTRGRLPPNDVFVQGSVPTVVTVSKNLWKPGEANILEFRAWKDGEGLRFPEHLFVGGPQEENYQGTVVTFLNVDLFLLFFGVNTMGGLYFLFLWLSRRQDIHRLWFAASTLLIGFYFYELGSAIPLFPGIAYHAIFRACLFWSIGALVNYLVVFLDLHNTRSLKWTVSLVFGLTGLYLCFATDLLDLAGRFTLGLIPLQLAILFCLYLGIQSLRRGNPDAPVVFTGIVLGVAFGSHDVVYMLTGNIPVAWLQGVGFFALEGSMFLALAMHMNRIHHKLEVYSSELEVQKEILNRTNNSFERFVPKELLGFLGKESVMDIELGDQVLRNMTILFTDIRNFTRMTESLSPKESFNLLNSYLAQMGPVIRSHQGVVDKFIGDAIMALFPDGPYQGVQAALAMRQRLRTYNLGRIRAGYSPIEMGIGLHTGALMLGTIGESQRMDSTVISDAVNTASRIEGLTKLFHSPLLISQDALDGDPRIAGEFSHRYMGKIPIRGKESDLQLYEILDPEAEVTPLILRHKTVFEAAVRSWEHDPVSVQTNQLFASYQELCPEDPSVNYFLTHLDSR